MLTNKEKRKLYLQGYKAFKSNRPTKNEHDLKMVKKINEFAKNGKIAIAVNNEYFYDSYDYAVEGYDYENVYFIKANYTAYRYFLNETERFADSPYSVKIIKQQ
tara:strand:+ start:49 stop:360 length:312 start_codon:yes stop_codon:yes gene_type:complete